MGSVRMRCDRRELLSLAAASLGLAGAASVLGHQASAAVEPLRIGLISDLNSSYGSTRYADSVAQGMGHLMALDPAFLLCAGDMVAGQKRGLSAPQLDRMWDSFARHVLLPVRQRGLPFLPAIGNHDGAPGFSEDRQAARRFWTPRRRSLGLHFADTGDFPFHYSVLQNNVFVLVWDASSSRIPERQLAWARSALASAQARAAGLRLVVGHLPLFGISRGRDRPGEVLHDAASIQRLLEEADVQAYISGHQHAWYPGRSGRLDLLQLGALGSGPRRLIAGTLEASPSFATIEVDWARRSLRETGYAATSGRAMSWARLPLQLQGHRGTVSRNRSQRAINSPAG